MAHGKMTPIREKVDESHGGNVVFHVLVGNPNGNIQRTISNSGGKSVKSCRTGNLQHRPLEKNGVHPNSVIQRPDFYRVDRESVPDWEARLDWGHELSSESNSKTRCEVGPSRISSN